MHHLLGITFGKESKLNILNLVSVLKNDGWIDAKLKPMLAFLNKRMKALYDDCYGKQGWLQLEEDQWGHLPLIP